MMNTQPTTEQSEPLAPSDMDFALPLVELASTLRAIGQNLLCSLLYGGCCPDWSALVPLEHARMLVQPRAFRRVYLRRWVARLTSRKPVSQDEEAVTRAIAGKLPLRKWRTRVLDQLKLRFGGPPSVYLPDDLWPVLSEIAWRDLDFQYWVAAQVRMYFRPRILFMPGERLVAKLSPITVWILIALAGAATSASRGFHPNQQTIRRAVRRLRNRGKQEALETTGWAGFWDQWIVSEALQHWPSALKSLDAELRDALLTLPLLNITSPVTLAQPGKKRKSRTETRQFAAPDWEKEMPEWFPALCKNPESKNGDE